MAAQRFTQINGKHLQCGKSTGHRVLFCCLTLADDALCQLFTLSGFLKGCHEFFTHGGLCEKGFLLRFLFFQSLFVCLKVVTDGALQVGFSFLPVLRKSGRINGWPWFIPAPCKLIHGWYPVTRCHSCEKRAERRLNSAVYSLSEAHPPAVRCASIAANTEVGES